MTGIQVAEAAMKYLGARYRHQGRTKDFLDCVGLPTCVAKDLGIEVYVPASYDRMPDGRTIMEELRKQMIPVYRNRWPGDVVAMVDQDWRARVCHLGVLTQGDPEPRIIHAYARSRKVIEHSVDDVWQSRIRGVYRFPCVVAHG